MIQGTNVELWPVRAMDLKVLRQWEQDAHISAMLGMRATALDSRETPEQEYERLLRTPRVKLLAIHTPACADAASTGEIVGFVRLNDVDLVARKASVRILIAPTHQGHGFGGAALRALVDFCFREMGLHRLGLVVREDNSRALELYKRLGFMVEGRERDAVWAEGRWVSFLHMGLLSDEWSLARERDAAQGNEPSVPHASGRLSAGIAGDGARREELS